MCIFISNSNGTRPSCAKLKVKVNLLGNFPKHIKIVEEADESGPEEINGFGLSMIICLNIASLVLIPNFFLIYFKMHIHFQNNA